MKYLIVVAHPDDEVLGAGATMYRLSQQGNSVSVCIMSGEARARAARPSDDELVSDIDSSSAMLGICRVLKGDFPNILFNNVDHLNLVKFIENAVEETSPDIVITHHPADTNNDHLHTSLACQAAIRLFQRRVDVRPVKELLFMEIPSATDWSVNKSMNTFTPNTFFEVGEEGIDIKIKALSTYRGVMRPYPHPRSPEVLKGLAAYRGGQSGLIYAEAFESVFRRGF